MSMNDRSEAAMTALVETVAEKVIGAERWAELAVHPDKYLVKVQLLPIVTAVAEAIDAEPRLPKRGDEVETWIRWHRDNYPGSKIDEGWLAIDGLIEDYIHRADAGTLLHETDD